MKVSVIIPLYNKSATINRAVYSILNQTHQDFEIIIVDDGSTDDSLSKANLFSSSKTKIIQQPNGGPGLARNQGAGVARYDLLAFLDADDEWRPDYLKTAVTALSNHPECVAYVCGYDSGDFRARRPNLIKRLGLEAGPATVAAGDDATTIIEQMYAMHSSCTVVRRDLFRKVGGFYDRDRCLFGEDSYLWLQVLQNGPVYWNPNEDIIFHVEDSSLGFAMRNFKKPTPISLHPQDALCHCPAALRGAMQSAIGQIVKTDVRRLVNSGQWTQARLLRREAQLPSVSLPADILRFVGHKVKQIISQMR